MYLPVLVRIFKITASSQRRVCPESLWRREQPCVYATESSSLLWLARGRDLFLEARMPPHRSTALLAVCAHNPYGI